MAPTTAPDTVPVLDAAVERLATDLHDLLALLPRVTSAVGASPDEAAHVIQAVEGVGRLMDAARVAALAPILGEPELLERWGYASATAAVATLCSIKETSARCRLKVAGAVTPDRSLVGIVLPPRLHQVGTALNAGHLGLDAATLIVSELQPIGNRIDQHILDQAETLMVAQATGVDAHGTRIVDPVSVDYLTPELRIITAAIDPDGARPREERAIRRRELRIGAQDADGLVPLHGRLLPEAGLLLAGLLEAHRRSPRFRDVGAADPADTTHLEGRFGSPGPGGAGPSDIGGLGADGFGAGGFGADGSGAGGFGADGSGAGGFSADGSGSDLSGFDGLGELRDDRTPAQRRHDSFLDILSAASSGADAPQLDGSPVTVLVTVTLDDLNTTERSVFARPNGLGGYDDDAIGVMADSTTPVSRRTVERYIDSFGYRKVALDNSGAIVGISSIQRCFTSTQRTAIAARDGARCATPGCSNPHYTLQAHHVIPVREHGPTTTHNGILLCFWHHQQVDTGPWHYLMIDGVPHARRSMLADWLPVRHPARRASVAS
jgi:hypothetical protein